MDKNGPILPHKSYDLHSITLKTMLLHFFDWFSERDTTLSSAIKLMLSQMLKSANPLEDFYTPSFNFLLVDDKK